MNSAPSGTPQEMVSPLSQMFIAKTEIESRNELFKKMAAMCFKKCVTSYHDPELQVGELACTDRCVSKYLQACEKTSEIIGNIDKQMKAQQDMQQALENKL